MRGIFIKVERNRKTYHINLLDSTEKEREKFYNTLSKGQIAHILEQFISNEMVEENRK